MISNPLHERNIRDWSLPTPSAFTKEEIAALKNWVERGGSLLLIADHMPFPGAAGDLAKAFEVEFSNGYARAGHWERGNPNTFATDALAQGFDELLWIDSDVVFQADDIEKLRGHGLPIVCGIYAKKSRREFACAFLPDTKEVRFGKHGGLTELRYAGFGFIYTRREVYETIQARLKLPVCNQRFGSLLVPYFAPFVVQDGAGAWYLSEDYGFCERARQSGFRIMADTSIRLWHVGNYRFGWEDAGSDKERFADYTFHINPGK